jgi:hypothetical protein
VAENVARSNCLKRKGLRLDSTVCTRPESAKGRRDNPSMPFADSWRAIPTSESNNSFPGDRDEPGIS